MAFINFFTFRAQRLTMLGFLTKLARLSRHSLEKERRQSETLFCVLQTSIVKTNNVGRIDVLCLKIDMTCKIENGFY